MPTNRKMTGIRFSDTGKRLLEQLAEETGLSQAAVMEMLVRDEARRRKIAIPKEEKEKEVAGVGHE